MILPPHIPIIVVSLPLSGAFNLTKGDTVGLYVKTTGSYTYRVMSYSSFSGIALTQSKKGFGVNLAAPASTSGQPIRNWVVNGKYNFLNPDVFDPTAGSVKSAVSQVHLLSHNVIYTLQTASTVGGDGDDSSNEVKR